MSQFTNKIPVLALLTVLIISIVLSVSSCRIDPPYTSDDNSNSQKLEDELQFRSSGSGYILSGVGSFSGTNLNIPAVYRGKPVTEIGAGAFSGCYFLVNVTLPNSISKIGEGAFADCNNLEIVHLDQTSLKKIPDRAFSGCEKLHTVLIPTSINEIGAYAFSGCKSLAAFSIDEQLEKAKEFPLKNCTTIGDYAFKDCTSFAAYNMTPSTTVNSSALKSVGKGAFYGCTSLTVFNVEKCTSFTAFSDEMFYGCAALNTLKLPTDKATVTSVGERAFQGCTALKSFDFQNISDKKPSQVASVGSYAFAGSGLTSAAVPSSVKEFGLGVFDGCEKLTSVTVSSTLYSIPNGTFRGCKSLTSVSGSGFGSTTKIGEYAFEGCTSLKNAFIPTAVDTVGDFAFANCTAMTSATIPANLGRIGYRVFSGCTALTSFSVDSKNTMFQAISSVLYTENGGVVFQYPLGRSGAEFTVPDGTLGIAAEAFMGAKNLQKINIGDSVTYIADSAFANCQNLATVNISDSLTHVGKFAFASCPALATVNLGSGVTAIGNSAFRNCAKLGAINLPEGLKELGSEAFLGCAAMSYVALPSTLENVGDSAFYGCKKLSTLTITDGVKTIGHSAFSGCTALSAVNMPASIALVGANAFENCGITSLNISDTASVAIAESAFANCSSLASATLGSAIEIARGAFSGCAALSEIVIPDTTVLIGDCAFENCSALSSVTVGSSVQSIGAYAFKNCTISSAYYTDLAAWLEISFAVVTNDLGEVIDISSHPLHRGASLNHADTSGDLTLTLPAGTKTLLPYAFYNCKNLVALNLNSELESISKDAFYGCANLDNVSFDSLDGWFNLSFANPAANPLSNAAALNAPDEFGNINPVITLKISGSVSEIKPYTFFGCTSIEAVVAPATLTKIGAFAFAETSPKMVYIENIASWSEIEFENATSNPLHSGAKIATIPIESTDPDAEPVDTTIYSLVISSGVNTVSKYAFYGCSSIKEIDVKANIAEYAFAHCPKLNSVTVNGNMAKYSFQDCSSIERADLSGSNSTVARHVFDGCTKLSFLVINKGVIAIEALAFEDCTKLSDVVVHSTLREVGKHAFTNSSIDRVYVAGSFYDWIETRIFEGNDSFVNAKRYYSELQNGELGNRWYYDANGNIVTEVMENLPL